MQTPLKQRPPRSPGAPIKAVPREQTLVDPRGIPLENMLTEETKKKLRGRKILYVVQPEMDVRNGIVKFGRGGMSASRPNSGFSRLQSYRISYGDFSSANPCTGVRCFLLAYGSGTYISQLENKLKREFKNDGLLRRGTERIEMRPADLVARIKQALETGKPSTRAHTTATLRLLTPFKTTADARKSTEGKAVHVRMRKIKFD